MNEAILEQELKNFDYATIHPVKEKILGRLLTMQRQRKAKPGGLNILQVKMAKRMDFDALEYAAAAGNATLSRKWDEQSDDEDEY